MPVRFFCPLFTSGPRPKKIALLVLRHPFAPIAQGIEHRPPEAGAQVRFLLGARRLLKTGENVRT